MLMVRALFAVIISASVAFLPIAAGMTQAAASEALAVAAHTDCCPEGKPCDKQTPGDCGGSAGCVLKCFNFSAALVAPFGNIPAAEASEKSAFLVESIKAPTENPPLPPPRF